MDDPRESRVLPIDVAFPLPFHVIVLVGLAILGWATNLHGLDILGIDVATAIDLRTDGIGALHAYTHHGLSRRSFNMELAVHYRAVYRLFMAYCLLGLTSWALYRIITHGDLVLVDAFGYIPAVGALLAFGVLLCPYNVLHKAERRKFIQCVCIHS